MLHETRHAFIQTINTLNSPGTSNTTYVILPGEHASDTICIKNTEITANPKLLTYMPMR